jgi:hypothetical protein
MGICCKNEGCLKTYGYYKIYLPNCKECKYKDSCNADDNDLFVFKSPTDSDLAICIDIELLSRIKRANCTLFGDVVLLELKGECGECHHYHYIGTYDLDRLFNFLESHKRYDILLKLRESY